MICRIECPCRFRTLISTACSWVNISTAQKKPPSSPRGVKITSAGVGHFYFGADSHVLFLCVERDDEPIMVMRIAARSGASCCQVPRLRVCATRFEHVQALWPQSSRRRPETDRKLRRSEERRVGKEGRDGEWRRQEQ